MVTATTASVLIPQCGVCFYADSNSVFLRNFYGAICRFYEYFMALRQDEMDWAFLRCAVQYFGQVLLP